MRATVALAERTALPVVATHPIQFIKPGDFRAHEARVCIAQGYVLGDPRRPREFHGSQYFKTQAEMAQLFADLPEALENTVEIARRCSFEFELGKSRLPDFPTPNGETIEDYLRAQATAGLERRLAALFPDEARRREVEGEYRARLEFETRTIMPTSSTGRSATRSRLAPGAVPARARSSPTPSALPASTRCATSCSSSASSTPSACRCPTSTSTSARTAATASSTT